MTEFIQEFFELAVFILLITIGIIGLIVLIYNIRISKYFTNRKYRITSYSEFEAVSQEESFSIHIYNNNVNDARLAAVGYIYKDQTIDYYKTYLKQINYALDGKIIIPSRDSIKIKIDIESLLKVINNYNQGKTRVKQLKCFVTDSLGMTTVVTAESVNKVIKKKLKTQRKKEKLYAKTQMRAQKEEKRETKRNARAARKQHRKIKRQRFIIWYKEKFDKLRRKRR